VSDLLDGGWFGHQQVCVIFKSNCLNQNAKRHLQNSSASRGKSVAKALEIFFSKLVVSTVSHFIVATKLQS
jgi:hypothetical protein